MPVSQPIWSLREGAGGEQLLGSLQRELAVSFIPLGDTAHETQTQLGAVQPVLLPAQGAAVMVYKRWEAEVTLIQKPPLWMSLYPLCAYHWKVQKN